MMSSKQQMEDYNKRIWTQHPEESDESFQFFFKFYLQLPKGTRTTVAAYRNMLVTERGMSQQEANTKNIGRYHHEYSNGRDLNGVAIEGLHTFSERAAAYDKWLFDDEVNAVLSRRGKLVEQEYQDSVRMQNAWELMITDLDKEYQDARNKAAEKGIPMKSGDYISKYAKLTDLRNANATFQRRAVGMMDKVTEDAILKALEDKNGMVIEWHEPEISKPEGRTKEEVKYDEMSEQEFEKMISASERLGGDAGKDNTIEAIPITERDNQ
jgi:hypothetical protein